MPASKHNPFRLLIINVLVGIVIIVGLLILVLTFSKQYPQQYLKYFNAALLTEDNGFTVKERSYYSSLAAKCNNKQSSHCCLSSVTTMAYQHSLVMPVQGCPDGTKKQMLRCPDSYQWCEPVQEETVQSPKPTVLCGDNICQEVVCTALGCPQPETPQNCPQDCK